MRVGGGALIGALAAYRASLAIAEELAARDASDTTWRRDLLVVRVKIGNVLAEQGDRAGALTAYREALAIGERLVAQDPSNATWQRDLSIACGRVGEVLRAEEDLEGACRSFRRALAILEPLIAHRREVVPGWREEREALIEATKACPGDR